MAPPGWTWPGGLKPWTLLGRTGEEPAQLGGPAGHTAGVRSEVRASEGLAHMFFQPLSIEDFLGQRQQARSFPPHRQGRDLATGSPVSHPTSWLRGPVPPREGRH